MTIEKRATRYALSVYPDLQDEETHLFSDCRRDHAHGARDQRKIDLDKACEWLNAKYEGGYVILTENTINAFRKAMEG